MTTLTKLRELRKKATRLSVSAWGQAEYELFIALVNWFDLPSTQALLDGSDKRDAERYRWLRENDGDGQVVVNWNIGHDWLIVEDLDATIDAALKDQDHE